MNFIKLENNELSTPTLLSHMGIDIGKFTNNTTRHEYMTSSDFRTSYMREVEDVIRQIGYSLVFYEYPTNYDKIFETFEPKKELTLDGKNFIQEFDVVPLPIDQIKINLKASAADKRWQVLTGGIKTEVGVFTTDDTDQLRITSANVGALIEKKLLDKNDLIDFKSKEGWIQITAEQLEQIGLILFKFGQACFTKEKEICDLIDNANSFEELKAINLNEGWPEGSLMN